MTKLDGLAANMRKQLTNHRRAFFTVAQKLPWVLGFYFTAWTLYFCWFWRKALFFDDAGNLVAGHVNIWGDWAAHLTMTTAMAERSLLLESSPFILNQPFSYPFVINLVSATLLRAGVPLIEAMVIPSLLLSIILVMVVVWFMKNTLETSRKTSLAAVTAASLFLLNGGLGFFYLGQEAIVSDSPWQVLLNPPHEVTRIDEQGIKWLNIIDSMVIPQRAFALGFPYAVLVLGLIYKERSRGDKAKKTIKLDNVESWRWARLGLAVGVLPLLHTHSFLALFVILTSWTFPDILKFIQTLGKLPKKNWSHISKLDTFQQLLKWGILAVSAGFMALPLIILFFRANTDSHFFSWHPGWYATEFKQNWFWFWLKNWGVVPFLAVFAFLNLGWRKFRTADSSKWHESAWIWSGFVILFIASNLWLFQPFIWDNTKLIVWASLGFAVLITKQFLSWGNHKGTLGTLKKLVIIVLFGISILSGLIDVYRISRHSLHSYQLYSSEELQLVSWVKTHTSPKSIWLTNTYHNHWLFNLTGRQAVLTYPGWLWTHGYDYRTQERDVNLVLNDPSHPQVANILEKYQVDYVVLFNLPENTQTPYTWGKPVLVSSKFVIYEVAR